MTTEANDERCRTATRDFNGHALRAAIESGLRAPRERRPAMRRQVIRQRLRPRPAPGAVQIRASSGDVWLLARLWSEWAEAQGNAFVTFGEFVVGNSARLRSEWPGLTDAAIRKRAASPWYKLATDYGIAEREMEETSTS